MYDKLTHLGSLWKWYCMTVPSHLPLTHHNVPVLLLHGPLDAPANDQPICAIADMHVLLLHPSHVERHEHLCRGTGHRSQASIQSATLFERTPVDHPVLTFLPSGDSRKFTLGSTNAHRQRTMTDWPTPRRRADGPTLICVSSPSSSPAPRGLSELASASVFASGTMTAATSRPQAT